MLKKLAAYERQNQLDLALAEVGRICRTLLVRDTLKLPDEMRDLAAHIIERKTTDFDPSKFEDRYENAVVELIRSKQSGQPARIEEAPRPSNVINLIDALCRSIEAEQPAAVTKKPPSKTSEERGARKPTPAKKPRPAAKKAG